MTLCTAPMRAQASMAMGSSQRMGRYMATASPCCTPTERSQLACNTWLRFSMLTPSGFTSGHLFQHSGQHGDGQLAAHGQVDGDHFFLLQAHRAQPAGLRRMAVISLACQSHHDMTDRVCIRPAWSAWRWAARSAWAGIWQQHFPAACPQSAANSPAELSDLR